MKHEIDKSELIYLKHCITEYNSLFIEIFNDNLRPKYHILTHYVNIIKKMGPVNALSSMRFEAFHKIGKTNAHIVTSRVNLLQTLSLLYQLRVCHRLQFKI